MPVIRERISTAALRNQILATLPEAVVRRVRRHSHPVELETGQILYDPGDRVRYAYFPERGVISVVNVMQEGRAIEVGTIGREGVTGVPALLGIDLVPFRHVVQVPGAALRMRIADLLEEARPEAAWRQLLLRYFVAFNTQVMQSVACAGLHSVEKRCCRWLLTTHDRVDSDTFSLTHEFLAFMLGTRRTSVSQILKSVQDHGLIRYRRGTITIVDRRGLEARSCECYRVVADVYHRLIGWHGG